MRVEIMVSASRIGVKGIVGVALTQLVFPYSCFPRTRAGLMNAFALRLLGGACGGGAAEILGRSAGWIRYERLRAQIYGFGNVLGFLLFCAQPGVKCCF